MDSFIVRGVNNNAWEILIFGPKHVSVAGAVKGNYGVVPFRRGRTSALEARASPAQQHAYKKFYPEPYTT